MRCSTHTGAGPLWSACLVFGILVSSCGSGGGTTVVTPLSPDLDPEGVAALTFNGALTQSFQLNAGAMEFNVTVLTERDPLIPLVDVSPSELAFEVTNVTDLQGIPLPVDISLTPASIINPPVTLATEPVQMTVLMDGSGSLFVTDLRDLRFEAAFGLVDQFRPLPLDLGAILRFDNQDTGFGVTPLGRPLETAQLLQPFTSDLGDLQRGILSATPGGETALYDAMVEAAQYLSDFSSSDAVNRRLVVFTDGIDNDSELSLNEAIVALQGIPDGSSFSISTYIVGLGSALELLELQQLADATDGTFALSLFPEQLGVAFANFFPAAVGEQRVQVAIASDQLLASDEYLLSGQITFTRDGAQVTTPFTNAVLIVP